MKKKNYYLFVLAMLFCSAGLMAQNKTVTGKVTDESGVPLLGVNIIEKGTGNGTSSDFDGNYSINVTGNTSILEYTSVGFLKQEVAVEGETTINVSMKEDTAQLDAVVITTALGLKRQKRSIGYAVQMVDAEEVTIATPVDLAQGLQGKVAGLNISTSNGTANASSRIVIRGNNNLFGNNEPLIVIDGAIVDNSALGQGNVDSSQESYRDWGNYLSYLDMSSVEDIAVLKGPNAAALYGARGANGVILITSKKGRKKEGLGLEYSTSVNFTNVTRFQDMQNEFGGGLRVAVETAEPKLPQTASGQSFPSVLYNGTPYPGFTGVEASHGSIYGGYNTWDLFSWFGASASWGPRLDGTPALWWDGEVRPYSPQPNNREYMYREAVETSHNVSFSTANDFGSIRIGINSKKGDAVVENTDYKSTSFSLGSHVNISKILSADVNANYNQSERYNTPSIGDNNSWSKMTIYGMSRDYKGLEKDIYEVDDLHSSKFQFPGAYSPSEYSRDLFWDVYNKNSTLNRDEFVSTLKLNAEFTPWLSAFVRTSADLVSTRFETINKTTSITGLNGGRFNKNIEKGKTFNTDFMAILHKDNVLTEGFNASLTLGYNQYSSDLSGVTGENWSPFKVPNIYSLSNYTNKNNTNAKETRYQVESYSYLGLLDLSYKNYLFLQVTGRQDTNSTLPVSDNSTFYPSLSTSFVFSDALDLGSFSDILSYGAARVAWGKSANATGPYQLDATFNTGAFGGQTTIGYPSTVPPTNLTFQTSQSLEFGLSLGFLKNRINLDVTYYDITSDNQIMDAAIPLSSGANRVRFNSGELSNKGFDFTLKATPIKTDDFTWNVTLNGSKNKNKIIALAEGVFEQNIASVFGTKGAFMKVAPGEDYGSIYGTDFELDDQGRKQVTNILNKDGSGEVIGTQYVIGNDPVKIGNAAPKLTGGLGNNFRYKNFRLTTLIDFKLGGDIYSFDHSVARGSGLAPETAAARNGGGLPYTYPDGTTDDVGMVMDGYNIDDGRINDRVIHPLYYYGISYTGWTSINRPRSLSVLENSWVKLRELSLTYDLPKSLLGKTKFVNNLSISVVGRNLFYIHTTLPDKLNPEAINGTGNGQGLQWAAFPSMRTVGFRLKAGF